MVLTQLERDGYLVVPGALPADLLQCVRDALDRVEADTRRQWQSGYVSFPSNLKPYGIGETAHVVYPALPHDDLFVDLLEYEPTLSTAGRFMGPDMAMMDNALHVKPAGTAMR